MSKFSKLNLDFSSKKRALLEALLEEEGLGTTKLEKIQLRQSHGPAPLSFAQLRLWFLDQLEPGNPAYNIPATVRFNGPLDISALEMSLNEIVRRHEILRTTFQYIDGQPMQVIMPATKFDLSVISLEHMSESDHEEEIRRLAGNASLHSFDLAYGPLFFAKLLRVSPEEYLFMMVMHHIISDGWSNRIFVDEMAKLYQAFTSGRTADLPELPIQYA